MLYFSLFLAGFTLGVFAALKIFAPEKQEESWDPQHLPGSKQITFKDAETILPPKSSLVGRPTIVAGRKLTRADI